MEFRLLGPSEVRDAEGRQLDAGQPMQRALLAMMLLHVGRIVSIETIIDDLWARDPPASAEKAVHATVSRLRKVLGSGVRIERSRSGYLLDVAPDAVDLTAFERLSSEGRNALARGQATEATGSLGRALALHRCPALAEFVERPYAGEHALRIERTIRAAEEDLVDARLALGQHDELLAIVERHVVDDPLSERRWCQLMTALYRAGRQTEALDAFQRARRRLFEALGLEPGIRRSAFGLRGGRDAGTGAGRGYGVGLHAGCICLVRARLR